MTSTSGFPISDRADDASKQRIKFANPNHLLDGPAVVSATFSIYSQDQSGPIDATHLLTRFLQTVCASDQRDPESNLTQRGTYKGRASR